MKKPGRGRVSSFGAASGAVSCRRSDRGLLRSLGGGLRGLDGGVGQRLEVGFGDVGGLLGGLLHAFHRVGGGGDGRLHQGGGGLGAGRGVLDGAVDGAVELGLDRGHLRFGDLAHFGVGGGGDVVQVAAVGGGLLGGGLQQAGLQGQQFLGILDAEAGGGGGLHFGHRGLGDLQV